MVLVTKMGIATQKKFTTRKGNTTDTNVESGSGNIAVKEKNETSVSKRACLSLSHYVNPIRHWHDDIPNTNMLHDFD